MCANLKDSAQRGANLTAAVMLIANLDFADMYGTMSCKTVVKGGQRFFMNAGRGL